MQSARRSWSGLLAVTLLGAFALSLQPAARAAAGATAAEPAAALASAPSRSAPHGWAATREATFDLVWRTVHETHFDPTFGGVDWLAVRERYAPRAAQARDAAALREVLGAMLGELGQTHFGIWPGESAVFAEDEALGSGEPGCEVAVIEGRLAIWRVRPGSPAARAGLHPGDVIEEIGGKKIAALQAALPGEGLTAARREFLLTHHATRLLAGEAGSRLELRVRDRRDRARRVLVRLAPFPGRWSDPVGRMPAMPLESELTATAGDPAYMRFNLFSPALMGELRAFLTRLPADTPGLLIDLRGNPGGVGLMASGLAGWLTAERFNLGTMQMREGHFHFQAFPQAKAFLGPVAVLVDARSASTSELMAAGLAEAGRARVFGGTTAGAALPSFFRELPTGDILQYAVADLKTPGGRLLEGRGAEPDVPLAPTLADLRAGRDPVRAAAEAWLRETANKSGASATVDPADGSPSAARADR